MPKYVFLVGQVREPVLVEPAMGLLVHQWEVQGIFDDIEAAEAVCYNDHYFVMRVESNKEYSDDTTQVNLSWYPKSQPRPDELI